MSGPEPVFSFGALADVQYADKATGHRDDSTQYFVSAARKVKHAVQDLNAQACELSCIVNLGDIIDGQPSVEASRQDLEAVAPCFDSSKLPVHHVIGNHCLCVGRDTILRRLKIPQPGYYQVELARGWQLLVLDTTEMSVHSGYAEDSMQAAETRAYYKQHATDVNLLPWNGGITSEQHAWLKRSISALEEKGQRCFVACHHPVGAGSTRESHYALGCKDLEDTLNTSRAVVAVLSGHDHRGGYSCVAGTHYIVLEAILESAEDSNAYCTIEVYGDRFEIVGRGAVTSRTCKLLGAGF